MAMINMKHKITDHLREMLIRGEKTFFIDLDNAGCGLKVEPLIHEGCYPRAFASNNAEWARFLDVSIDKYIDGFKIVEPQGFPVAKTVDELEAFTWNYMTSVALGLGG